MKYLNQAKNIFLNIINNNLINENIAIKMKPLKPEEAIGYPKRDDYPLLQGKEVLVEANFKGAKGQAFTDEPFDFVGSINDIVNLKLKTNRERALFVSTLNAILRYLNLAKNTVHCKDNEPEECAKELSDYIYKNYGTVKITLVGLQPSFAQHLIEKFNPENITILDLNPKNFGKNFDGVIIKNSKKFLKDNLANSDIIIATGSTVVNDTIDDIIDFSKEVIFYGTTISGVAKLLNLKRFCFKSH